MTPPLTLHPAMEFGNRMVVVGLCTAAAVTLVCAVFRSPRRRDLVTLSALLVGGIVGEAVLGEVVVYSKLNPYAVMTHFMVGIALLTVALALALHAGRAPGRGPAKVPYREFDLQPPRLGPAAARSRGRDRHHGGRPPRGRPGSQTPARAVGRHGPHPFGNRPGAGRRCARAPLPSRARRSPSVRSIAGARDVRSHGGPGGHRLHAVLQPPPGTVGRRSHLRGHGRVERHVLVLRRTRLHTPEAVPVHAAAPHPMGSEPGVEPAEAVSPG